MPPYTINRHILYWFYLADYTTKRVRCMGTQYRLPNHGLRRDEKRAYIIL